MMNTSQRKALHIRLAARRHKDHLARRTEPDSKSLPRLYQIGQELSAALDIQRVTEQLLHTVTGMLQAEASLLWLWEKNTTQQHRLHCRGVYRSDSCDLSTVDFYLPPGRGIAGWVAKNGQSVALSDAQADPRFYAGVDTLTGLHTMSLLAVPLRGRETVIGVLEVINKREGYFHDDAPLVEMLATSAAIAIENATLVKTLHFRTHELQTHNEELDAFAHTTAHDLQNLLGRIVGFAEALQQTHRDLPAEEIYRYLNIISTNGRKMSIILDALLLLAKVRQEDVKTHPLNMDDIIHEALARLADMIGEHKAEVQTATGWPTAHGYAPWVEEVWVNYVSNAIKYGGQREANCPPQVELGFSPAGSSLFNGSSISPSEVVFWVRDHGVGLTAEEQARLFIPFERLNRTHKEGHGLGLSITKRIVEKLRGKVGVQSQPGEGSLFWFTLPTREEFDL
ncbi:MAG: GAF domain-containing protein [Anaerolineae bacterium]|nr:GAF domain-containing protein [Anaerolineae bacterium]